MDKPPADLCKMHLAWVIIFFDDTLFGPAYILTVVLAIDIAMADMQQFRIAEVFG